jgi:hypothetical protein
MWWLILPGALGVSAVLAIGACIIARPGPYEPRHLAAVPDPSPGQDFYGSMQAADEHKWTGPMPRPRPRLENPEPDWREQTAADLSPAALGAACPDDPGPGVLPSLVPPGPVPLPEPPAPPAPTRLADTGDIRDARLLAEVTSLIAAQDDDARAFIAHNEAMFAEARTELAAALVPTRTGVHQ